MYGIVFFSLSPLLLTPCSLLSSLENSRNKKPMKASVLAFLGKLRLKSTATFTSGQVS